MNQLLLFFQQYSFRVPLRYAILVQFPTIFARPRLRSHLCLFVIQVYVWLLLRTYERRA